MPLKDQPKICVFDAGEIQESIKVDKVMELIEEHHVNGGARMAVFSQFKTGLAELERRLSGANIRVVRFDGDTPDRLKERIKTNFDKSVGEAAEWDIVLCNYKTGGVGLNLTAATHTIILDEEWNPGKRDQAYARTHRMGQDEKTFVHVIRLNKTVDSWLSGLIEEKEEMIAGFNESAESIQDEMLKALKDGEISG
jgi:SNF2 family DNA or RNA helicase